VGIRVIFKKYFPFIYDSQSPISPVSQLQTQQLMASQIRSHTEYANL